MSRYPRSSLKTVTEGLDVIQAALFKKFVKLRLLSLVQVKDRWVGLSFNGQLVINFYSMI